MEKSTDDFQEFWSRYTTLMKLIEEEKEKIVYSDKFNEIIGGVEELHKFVSTPRKLVMDCEVVLTLVNSLSSSIKSFCKKEISPADFVASLLKKYGEDNGSKQSMSFNWNDLGESVSGMFPDVSRCCSTMVGPMESEPKKKRVVSVKRKRGVVETEHPHQLPEAAVEERNQTEENVAAMFEIMRARKKPQKIQNLVMNRKSYAQTVENIFALSFLVKDGRAEMKLDGDGNQMVSLRNAPDPEKVKSGEVKYRHFVLRVDYKDWIKMRDVVTAGNEVMPHRVRNQ